jgi:hypothetical protein
MVVRFVCGTLAGVLLGLGLVIDWSSASLPGGFLIMVCIMLASMGLCGWLATRFGDRFWMRLHHWL